MSNRLLPGKVQRPEQEHSSMLHRPELPTAVGSAASGTGLTLDSGAFAAAFTGAARAFAARCAIDAINANRASIAAFCRAAVNSGAADIAADAGGFRDPQFDFSRDGDRTSERS